MFFPLILVAAGWALAKRGNKPAATKVIATQSMGSVSGINYAIDQIPATGTIIVRHQGAEVVLRAEKGKWMFVRGHGEANVINTIIRDFSAQLKSKPAADDESDS